MIHHDQALRLCKAVIFETLLRLFPDRARRLHPAQWGAAMRLDEDGLGFDSLARIDLVSVFNTRFSLQSTGVEDYMYIQPQLDIWADLLEEHFRLLPTSAAMGFFTSGSTGAPKILFHPLEDLLAEIDVHIAHSLVDRPGRIVALVPPQHIYGFLFTVLLPSRLKVSVLDLSEKGPGALSRHLDAGDLVIATPHLFARALPFCSGKPLSAHALSSTAPAPDTLWTLARRAGLASVTEIYGSSETGGVGTRRAAGALFRLLPHLDAGDPPTRNGQRLDLQDHLSWQAEQFRVLGRRDHAIQIGGHNVSMAAVAATLERHPHVAQAYVRPEGERIKAFVVPCPGVDPLVLEDTLRSLMDAEHAPAARPVSYTFGASLPRNALGKVTDWSNQMEMPLGG